MNPHLIGGFDFHELLEWEESFQTEQPRPIDRLAASLFVNGPDPRTRLMAMFTAYFDASGNAVDQPFVVVSGYIANYLQWGMFENIWTNVHKEHGVDLPFHMADFMAAQTNPQYHKQKNARQDYVAIVKDNKRATEFYKSICLAQVSVVNCAVSCTVPMRVYEGVSSLLDIRKVVPPYALAARSCIARIHQWESDFGIEDSPVECIFEEGDFEQGKFTELMIYEGMGTPIYKKKKDYAGLQGADHYAWEQSYFSKREQMGIPTPHRNTLKLLLKAIPKLHVPTTTATLIDLCHEKGIDPRTGVKHDKKK